MCRSLCNKIIIIIKTLFTEATQLDTCQIQSYLLLHYRNYVDYISGVFTCGPSPKKAIKNGECWLPYDTSFVFSEVNADIIHWELTEAGARRFKLEPRA